MLSSKKEFNGIIGMLNSKFEVRTIRDFIH